MPGCMLFAGGDVVAPLCNADRTASPRSTVPNEPRLLGRSFSMQETGVGSGRERVRRGLVGRLEGLVGVR